MHGLASLYEFRDFAHFIVTPDIARQFTLEEAADDAGVDGAVCDAATTAWLREIGDRYDWAAVSPAGAA